MAKGFHRRWSTEHGCAAEVASAGLLPGGQPAVPEVIDVMARRGIDLTHHRSRTLTKRLLQQADLVLTMTRQQLIDVATMAEASWSKCFTVADAVHRAEAIGPLDLAGTEAAWLRLLHGARQRRELLDLPLRDDVADPMRGRIGAYERAAEVIEELVSRLQAQSQVNASRA